jgi:hypothetical protein
MTEEEKTGLLKALSLYVREEILKAFEPLRERIDALEATGIRYQGVYQKAQEYRRGDVCTHDGSMWVATCDIPSHQIPGNSSRWQLSVKRGADGRDANRSPTRSVSRVG